MAYVPLPGAPAAHSKVQKAVSRGDLPAVQTQTCVDCGAPATDYDHRDYNKPLDVEPVCRPCNGVRGPGIPKGCNYTHGYGYGIVADSQSVRAAVFQVWDFGDTSEPSDDLIVLEDTECGVEGGNEVLSHAANSLAPH